MGNWPYNPYKWSYIYSPTFLTGDPAHPVGVWVLVGLPQVEPQNSALLARHAAVQQMREAKVATVPTILKHEMLGCKLNDQKLNVELVGGFKYFLFSPRKLGKIPILTDHIFQMG